MHKVSNLAWITNLSYVHSHYMYVQVWPSCTRTLYLMWESSNWVSNINMFKHELDPPCYLHRQDGEWHWRYNFKKWMHWDAVHNPHIQKCSLSPSPSVCFTVCVCKKRELSLSLEIKAWDSLKPWISSQKLIIFNSVIKFVFSFMFAWLFLNVTN